MVDRLIDQETGNRVQREKLACLRLAASSGQVQPVKLADLISNTRTIVEHDPNSPKVYLREKADLSTVLRDGDERLRSIAWGMVPVEYWP